MGNASVVRQGWWWMATVVVGINLLLERCFLIVSSLAIVMQLCLVTVYLFTLIEMCCQWAAKWFISRSRLVLTPVLFKNIFIDFIFEAIKLWMDFLAFNSVTRRWKYFNLVLYAIFFAFLLYSSCLSFNQALKIKLFEGDRLEPEMQLHQHIVAGCFKVILIVHVVCYLLGLACLANFFYIHWDNIIKITETL